MQEGGLIVDGLAVNWVNLKEFQKRGLKRLIYNEVRPIGKTNFILSQTRVPGAFFCERCNKVIGFFDVINDPDGE